MHPKAVFQVMTRLIFSIAFFLSLLFFGTTGACQDVVAISTDINYWYPYTYTRNGLAKGMHVDIVKEAFTRNHIQVTFTPLPWKRCLKEAEAGIFNAVVSASYKKQRARHFYYPPDAAASPYSKWRITQAEYVIVHSVHQPFEFIGNLLDLPKPVRVPLGYSIGDDLRKQNIRVRTGSDTYSLMLDLIRSQKGVFITPRLNAVSLQKDPRFTNQILVQERSIASKSYFIIFSKKKPILDSQQRQRAWDTIAQLRDDQAYMSQLAEKYYPIKK